MRTGIAGAALIVCIVSFAMPPPASATFVDVLPDHPFFTFVYALSVAGVTAGCSTSPPLYCAATSVTRAQMAIFLLRGMHGPAYVPPPATGFFADVPVAGNPAAPFIEQLKEEGVTIGCATGPPRFCPGDPVTRAQMAIFLLRAKYGAAHTPPPATGMFVDVPVDGNPSAPFIEQLANEEITVGCVTSPAQYCPGNPVTRGQMAVFLVRTFGLPMFPSWLAQVNNWRARAGLPGVVENTTWSQGDLNHAIYSVKEDVVEHDEDPASPWFTPEGQTAAQNGNGAGNFSPAAPDSWAIEAWIQGPFHSVGVLSDALGTSGFGSFREAGGVIQTSAWLDVNRGVGSPSGQPLPILFPADGVTIPIPNRDICPAGTACHWGEFPSPLTSCPGYVLPAGLPLILQFTPFTDPVVTASSLVRDGVGPLEHCVFTGGTYANPDGPLQALGRAIINARGGVVLIPRDPLPAGSAYTASVTANGQAHQWNFAIALPPATDALPDARIPDWATTAIPPSFDLPRVQ